MTARFGLEIRAATAADAPGLATLLATAGLAVDPRALAERLAALREGQGTALLAWRWGPPSGLVLLHRYPTLDDARPTGRISGLLVAPEERRLGIGRLLVKAAAQAARAGGCGRLELAAPAGAPFLREFCKATGFAEAGACFIRSLRRQG